MKNYIAISIMSILIVSVAVIHPQTELINAVINNNYKTVKMLVKNTNINELDNQQKTALDYAVEYGNIKIALLLAKHGGKVTRNDNQEYLKNIFLKRSFVIKIIFYAGLFITFPILLMGTYFGLIVSEMCSNSIIEPLCLFVFSMPMLFVVIPCAVRLSSLKHYFKKNWMLETAQVA